MKKKIIIVGLLSIAVVAVVEIRSRKNTGDCGGCPGGACTLPIPAGPTSVGEEKAIHKPLPRMLDLGAGKCVPCKMMMPIIEEMKTTFSGQLDVEFIDVWENQKAGKQYGIRMIPTQIFFDAAGNELFRHEGFISRKDLLARWKELGYAFAGKPLNGDQGTSEKQVD